MPGTSTPLIVLKELAGHVPPHLDPLQQFLADHIVAATHFWIFVWCGTAIVLLVQLWHEYKEQNESDN